MSVSPAHERWKCLRRRLIETAAEEQNLPISGFGSATLQREGQGGGLEPAECYYTRNLARMRGARRIDLSRDPPPDLAVEIDVPRGAPDRSGLYAALGVPELWRFDGEALRFYRRTPAGGYEPAARSPTFPSVPAEDWVRFLRQGDAENDTAMARDFREWLMQVTLAPPGG
jgi:Uma2 family endonuclease